MLYERIGCFKKSYVMISSVIKLEHKAEVNEEREFLRDVTVSDGYMKLKSEKSDNLNRLIDGLYRHTLQLKEQYSNDITVKISEV